MRQYGMSTLGELKVHTIVPADKLQPLLRLNKNTKRVKFVVAEVDLAKLRYQIARAECMFKRLFFLKKFGFPFGCILDSFNCFLSVYKESCTSDGFKTGYAYNGIRFMDKILKLTSTGWQVEFIYRE